MAKKVFLQDQDEKLLPITRGELVLDSSGEEAFHSEEFLANNSQPGLMSAEDKTRLNLIAAQATPIIFGNDTDTTTVWTGTSDRVSSYSEGMSIIFVPKKTGTSSTTLAINSLDALPLVLKGGISSLLADTPIQLTLINNEWIVFDKDTTYTMPYGLYVFSTHNSGILLFKNTGSSQTLINKQRSQYFLLVMPTNYTCVRSIEYIAFGQTLTGKLPLKVDGKTLLKNDIFEKGQYIAYWDGETCYINTDGTLPGKIEKSLYSDKAALAEQVEWNEVTSGETDTNPDDFVSTVANSQYLIVHNLGALEKNPSDFNTQVITAWLNQEGMPTTDVYSGINVAGFDTQTQSSWQLCSGAALNNAARLWFRSGIADEWKSWRGIAVLDDLVTHGRGESIGAGSNIDSKTSPGIYYSSNASYSGTLTNPPTTDSGFRLMTFSGYVANQYGMQVAHSSNNIYFRFLGENNSACSDWYQLIKFRPGTSIGSSNRPMYLSADGVPTALHYTIESSVPFSAKFTDTKCASLALDTSSSWESEDDTVSVLSEQRIEAYGDGTYLYGSMESTPVPTKAYVDRTFKTLQNSVSDPTANGYSTTFISSISQDANGQITVEKKNIQVSAGDLGITTAMKYIGKTDTELSDGSTEKSIIIGGTSYTMSDSTAGNIVIDKYNHKEFIWNGGSWEELGAEGAQKNTYVSSTQWNAGNYNGPTLTLNYNNNTAYTTSAIPSASISDSGIVTIGEQTFAGKKIFTSTVIAPRVDCAVGTKALANVAEAHSLTYTSGGKTTSQAVSDDSTDVAYAGSSSVYGVYSYPEGATAVNTNGTANIMNLRLTWSNKYFHDIFCSPNYSELWHRRVYETGESGWSRIMTENKTGTNYVYDAAVNKIAYLDAVSVIDGKKHNVDCNQLSGFGVATNYHSMRNFNSEAENTYNTGSWIHFPKDAYGGVLNIGSGPSVVQGQLAWELKHGSTDTTGDLYWRASAITGSTSIWDKASWKKIAYSDDAKYCNDATLKSADFPGYNSELVYVFDESIKEGSQTEKYFKALCKYVYSKYKTEQASNFAITLLGQARPGSTGTLLMSLYPGHGTWANDTAMPKYASGLFTDLSGIQYVFSSNVDSNNNGVWKWARVGTVTSITPGTGLTRTADAGTEQVDTSITTSGTINLKPAATNELGGVKVSETNQSLITANQVSTIAGRYYGMESDISGKAFVNVPWTDTKNTAGSTDNTSTLFIIGAAEQSDNPQTYSNSNVIIQGSAVKAKGGFYQESDERLKDFTEDIQVDLEQLSQLPKKQFTWKNDSKKETQIGTSAQELQKLYPELVKEDSNGTLSVAYDKLSIIALKAIDELYKRNVELEKRIQELENK